MGNLQKFKLNKGSSIFLKKKYVKTFNERVLDEEKNHIFCPNMHHFRLITFEQFKEAMYALFLDKKA